MIHDATCTLCGTAHAAEQLDARGRCSGCLREIGHAKTLRPPPRGETCVARYLARVGRADGAGRRGSVRHPDCQGCLVGALRAASVAAAARTAPPPVAQRPVQLLGSTPRSNAAEGDSR